MVDPTLLSILVCPETKSPLEAASPELVNRINALVKKGALKNRAGQKVEEPIDGGLVRKDDRKFLYAIRDDIPVMLIDEAIPLAEIQNPS